MEFWSAKDVIMEYFGVCAKADGLDDDRNKISGECLCKYFYMELCFYLVDSM